MTFTLGEIDEIKDKFEIKEKGLGIKIFITGKTETGEYFTAGGKFAGFQGDFLDIKDAVEYPGLVKIKIPDIEGKGLKFLEAIFNLNSVRYERTYNLKIIKNYNIYYVKLIDK